MRKAGDGFMERSPGATAQDTTIQLVLQQDGPPAASDLRGINETSKGLHVSACSAALFVHQGTGMMQHINQIRQLACRPLQQLLIFEEEVGADCIIMSGTE